MANVKLIIEIPDNVFEYAEKYSKEFSWATDITTMCIKAIANGTPLSQSNDDYYEIIVPKGIWSAKYKMDLLFEPRAESEVRNDNFFGESAKDS